jgi:hypothetical protein
MSTSNIVSLGKTETSGPLGVQRSISNLVYRRFDDPDTLFGLEIYSVLEDSCWRSSTDLDFPLVLFLVAGWWKLLRFKTCSAGGRLMSG